ncbi:uncharacterized protein EI97DRAFT_158253 [Westerdykella ornata]|uniref:Uncharacterized protein n=1 Tax=Westerdykella ornata TaxID=318751 RepID=A0A6A6JAL0_WESOR|nr:uncharacterized protein EI97DRAFT_158253 [Westerdykella ornata]KAF2273442.1 hypothetical protein EI97DRAFT_158253 [Westerdykella ornata]
MKYEYRGTGYTFQPFEKGISNYGPVSAACSSVPFPECNRKWSFLDFPQREFVSLNQTILDTRRLGGAQPQRYASHPGGRADKAPVSLHHFICGSSGNSYSLTSQRPLQQQSSLLSLAQFGGYLNIPTSLLAPAPRRLTG